MEVIRRRGTKHKNILDDFKDGRGYSHMKEEALGRTTWRNRFGRGFWPAVRQNTEWMNGDWEKLIINCDNEYCYNYDNDIFLHEIERIAVGMSLFCGLFRTGECSLLSIFVYWSETCWGGNTFRVTIFSLWLNCCICTWDNIFGDITYPRIWWT
jgi:hypothetical protein